MFTERNEIYVCLCMWSFREVRIGNGNKRVTIIVYTEACYASVFLTEWKYYIKKLFLLFSQYQQNLKLSFWLLLTYLHRETIKVTSKRKQRKCHLNIFKEKWTEPRKKNRIVLFHHHCYCYDVWWSQERIQEWMIANCRFMECFCRKQN